MTQPYITRAGVFAMPCFEWYPLCTLLSLNDIYLRSKSSFVQTIHKLGNEKRAQFFKDGRVNLEDWYRDALVFHKAWMQLCRTHVGSGMWRQL